MKAIVKLNLPIIPELKVIVCTLKTFCFSHDLVFLTFSFLWILLAKKAQFPVLIYLDWKENLDVQEWMDLQVFQDFQEPLDQLGVVVLKVRSDCVVK